MGHRNAELYALIESHTGADLDGNALCAWCAQFLFEAG